MKRTVLVVDDEQNMQTVMRMILEDAGHVVITAGSGEEAVKHIQDPNLDVVLFGHENAGHGRRGTARALSCRSPGFAGDCGHGATAPSNRQ